MAVCDLARHDGGRPVSLAEIAARQRISVSYLEQMFAQLRRAHFVRSVRGPGGGYLLAKPSAQIRISDIIVAIDQPRPVGKARGGASRGDSADPTKALWDEVGRHVLDYLDGVTVADIVGGHVPPAQARVAPAMLGSAAR